jgi:CRP-like cAMP-binding protein
MSLLTGEPRAASVIAAVPTEILELDARTSQAYSPSIRSYCATLP